MAVLHHAFRCEVTPEFDQDLSEVVAAWEAGDSLGLSALALDGYAKLAERHDLHASFFLHPNGSASLWMLPTFVTPGLAALAMVSHRFVSIPCLSTSCSTNHYLLETQLPLLGWSATDVALLVRGHSIEAMLERSVGPSSRTIEQSGFRHTGGWTPGADAEVLKARIDQLIQGPPLGADPVALEAWTQLGASGALKDAGSMLAEVPSTAWLVMAITH